MQKQSVDTRAGTAIWAAPSRMASRCALPFFEVTLNVFNRNRCIVHENSDREANPPRS